MYPTDQTRMGCTMSRVPYVQGSHIADFGGSANNLTSPLSPSPGLHVMPAPKHRNVLIGFHLYSTKLDSSTARSASFVFAHVSHPKLPCDICSRTRTHKRSRQRSTVVDFLPWWVFTGSNQHAMYFEVSSKNACIINLLERSLLSLPG